MNKTLFIHSFALIVIMMVSSCDGCKSKKNDKSRARQFTLKDISRWPVAQKDALVGKKISDAPTDRDTLVYNSEIALYALVHEGSVTEWKDATPAEEVAEAPVQLSSWGQGNLCLVPKEGEDLGSFVKRLNRQAEKKKCLPDQSTMGQMPALLDPNTSYCVPCEKIKAPECDNLDYDILTALGWVEQQDLPWYAFDKYGNLDPEVAERTNEKVCHNNDLVWLYYVLEE